MKIKYIIISILIAATFISIIPTVLSQEYGGSIYDLRYTPKEPLIGEKLSISVAVLNPKLDNSYVMEILISKSGNIYYKQKFGLELKSNTGASFSVEYVPNDIDEFNIIAKLYDKFETELYDSKITIFNVKTDIGPFDLGINTPSVAKKLDEIPVVVSVENKGNKGTDVGIKVSMECYDRSEILNEFFIFSDANSALDKSVSLLTCNENGLHTVSSSIILFNKTIITARKQLYLNDSLIQLYFNLPELEIEAGESRDFGIEIQNPSYAEITNLKLFAENIPLSWINILPKSINRIGPQNSVIFIVNISVPDDAVTKTYPLKLTVAGDNIIGREQTSIKVLQGAAPLIKDQQIYYSSVIEILDANKYFIIGILGVVFAVIVIIKVRKRKSKSHYRMQESIRRIKDTIKS